LEIAHRRATDEALDLDGDLLPAFLGAQSVVPGAQIDVEILIAVFEAQGIIRDRPPVGGQGVNDGVVIDVPGGHGLRTNSQDYGSIPVRPSRLDDYTIRV
jgi:hypothetical protein